jgi:hypothetical protein
MIVIIERKDQPFMRNTQMVEFVIILFFEFFYQKLTHVTKWIFIGKLNFLCKFGY